MEFDAGVILTANAVGVKSNVAGVNYSCSRLS